MKLFTHNMLTSKMIKSVKVGYPLKLTASEVKVTPTEYRPAFVTKMIPKIEWAVLLDAFQKVDPTQDLPPTVAENYDQNEDFLKKAHHALFEVEVITGFMECPETGRKFPIQNGVPNMLVNEDEV